MDTNNDGHPTTNRQRPQSSGSCSKQVDLKAAGTGSQDPEIKTSTATIALDTQTKPNAIVTPNSIPP